MESAGCNGAKIEKIFWRYIVRILNKNEDDYILKISNSEFITRILSEQILSYGFIDWDAKQTLNQFVNFTKENINYSSDDFLIKINAKTLEELQNKQRIEFYKVDSFGWYNKKNHRTEIKLFNVAQPNKLKNLKEQNPIIELRSFDQFRIGYRSDQVNNILNGAFGLSYHCFKQDYDNFFRKIRWEKDTWYLKLEELTAFDRQILIQILLYNGNEKKELIDVIAGDSPALLLYADILNHSLEYFISEDYSMKGFLEYLANKIDNEGVVQDLTQLSELYVAKGLTYDPKIQHTQIIKEFLDVAKTEKGSLKEDLNNYKNNKSSIFLLGMLHLGDRLDEQFEFDNFIPSIVALTMGHIVDISIEGKFLLIGLNETETDKNRNNKFTYIHEYFDELNLIKRMQEEIEDLKEKTKKLKSITESSSAQQTMEMYDEKTKQNIKSEEKIETPKKLFSKHNNVHHFFYPRPHSKEYMPKPKRKKTSVKSLLRRQMFKLIKVIKK